jgi:SpoVK/Ycf46/Vps4 family AAA+-type ATPase
MPRRRILERHTASLPGELQSADMAKILELTDAFTGADVKRLVEDAKSLYGFDRARQLALRTATEYFTEAAGAVRENKLRYQAADDAARSQSRNAGRSRSTEYYNPQPSDD